MTNLNAFIRPLTRSWRCVCLKKLWLQRVNTFAVRKKTYFRYWRKRFSRRRYLHLGDRAWRAIWLQLAAEQLVSIIKRQSKISVSVLFSLAG